MFFEDVGRNERQLVNGLSEFRGLRAPMNTKRIQATAAEIYRRADENWLKEAGSLDGSATDSADSNLIEQQAAIFYGIARNDQHEVLVSRQRLQDRVLSFSVRDQRAARSK
jgi:hypothetical protein